MNPLLSGLSKVYGAVSGANHALYDKGLRRIIRLPVPVISIGNLTVGGTGKTPLTSYCLSLLKSKGHRPGLVVRSYGVPRKVPGRVQAKGPQAAADFGDEAVWYAIRHPDVPVWSGPRKWETAQALAAAEKIDVLLVDDGYQHRALHRDLNLLLLDSTDPLAAYEPLPAGRAREFFSASQRADAFLWTKANLAPAPAALPLPKDKAVFHFESGLQGEAPVGPVLLVSGIARPETFRRMVEEMVPGLLLEHAEYRDHHSYDLKDVEKILARALAMKATCVLTTEKDAVKLRPLWKESSLPLRAMPLEVRLRESVESFYDLLARPLR